MADVIFVGLSTIDVLYSVDKFPKANEKVAARSQEVFVGGPATNACIAYAHLGGKAALVTAVGKHPLAAMAREEAVRYGIQLIDLNAQFAGVPPISSVTVAKNGQRNVVSANAVRVETPETAVDHHVLDKARMLMVDGHYMQACQAWAAAARVLGKPVVFDGGSWKDGCDELLKNVTTAICSADFLPPGSKDGKQVVEYLRARGVTNVAITHGSEPIEFISGMSSGTLRVPHVEVVDTTGAGDVLHGAYCYHASLGHGFIEALSEAAEIAAESCRYEGTRAWMEMQAVGARD
ncbi:MAG: PfkB family carbohydrate kinase [Terracidiphilus sp.]